MVITASLAAAAAAAATAAATTILHATLYPDANTSSIMNVIKGILFHVQTGSRKTMIYI